MTALTLTTARAIVAGALEGKYDHFGEAELERKIVEAWDATESVSSEGGLVSFLRPTEDFSTDVMNHVVVLRLIESFWRFRSGMKDPICHIHQAVYGVPDSPPKMRATEYVGDFGGVIPTQVAYMRGALAELELVVERLTPVFGRQPVPSQAVLLAHLFSSIIRVHPFDDGNGRAARMTVQYCLRCWDRPYLPLPKVRNLPAWHDALEQAVAGDQSALLQEFVSRMTRLAKKPEVKGGAETPER